jgi:2-polyprenyl-6-methoxyphenol hydroxylase-like FAD-dependent oxidoreductase
MMSERYDLIIVGGGLGGSSLAASIAKHGARVLLLEREHQFKDRVRGECVFPWGVAEAIQMDALELLRDRDDIGAPEDTGQIVFNYRLGEVAVLLPQGEGRARTYFCFHAGAQPRYQGTADFPRYLESFKRAGMNPEFYDGAKAAGPLATFDGAEAWVEHPYRDGVALIGDAAAASDPTWGQGLSLTLRDARVLRDQLLDTEDWETAGHAYAREHDRHTEVSHAVNLWFAEFYLGTGPQADARRARALPLIAEDPSRQPDAGFSGPDIPANDAVKKRFFAED